MDDDAAALAAWGDLQAKMIAGDAAAQAEVQKVIDCVPVGSPDQAKACKLMALRAEAARGRPESPPESPRTRQLLNAMSVLHISASRPRPDILDGFRSGVKRSFQPVPEASDAVQLRPVHDSEVESPALPGEEGLAPETPAPAAGPPGTPPESPRTRQILNATSVLHLGANRPRPAILDGFRSGAERSFEPVPEAPAPGNQAEAAPDFRLGAIYDPEVISARMGRGEWLPWLP